MSQKSFLAHLESGALGPDHALCSVNAWGRFAQECKRTLSYGYEEMWLAAVQWRQRAGRGMLRRLHRPARLQVSCPGVAFVWNTEKNPKEFDKKSIRNCFLIFIKNSRKLKKVLFFELAFFYNGKYSSKIDRFSQNDQYLLP